MSSAYARLTTERQPSYSGDICRPREQPHKIQRPEQSSRDGVVVPRISSIEESKQLFIDEVEPEEAVILARATLQRKEEVRRISERREYMPRGSNQEHHGNDEWQV